MKVISYYLQKSFSSIFYVVLPHESQREGIIEFENNMENNGFSISKTILNLNNNYEIEIVTENQNIEKNFFLFYKIYWKQIL